MDNVSPKEGDLFEVVNIGGHNFVIQYGYYSDEERGRSDPIPIYPCFISQPRYTPEGKPLSTRIQDACEHYTTEQDRHGDGWCADCVHYVGRHDEIGICECAHRRIDPSPKLA